ncbi:MAG: carbohydrate kinase family protein, partial [bacterium]
MYDIIGIGDSDVDLMIKVTKNPKRDEKVRGELLGKFPGGIIGNFCCAASRFGAKTSIATVLGNDEYGNMNLESFKNFGVNTDSVIINNKDTYFCVVHLDSSGEKALTLVETENLTPEISDIDIELLKQTRFIHLTSLDFKLAEFVC